MNNAWEEIDNIKGNMAAASADIVGMKSEIRILKDQLKVEKDRNVKLEQYTRRENIRLLNVAEGEDEDTEQLFINPILDGVIGHPILDRGGGKKAPTLTLNRNKIMKRNLA